MPRSPKHFFSLLVLVIILPVVIALVSQNQRLITKAWSGITTNFESLGNLLKLVPQGTKTLPSQTESKSSRLYQKLVRTYPSAEVQDIELPTLAIHGKAYLYYDKLIDKTYVFSRLENLPYLSTRIVRLWLTDDAKNEYTPTGIGEFIQENGLSVTHSVFVQSGNLKEKYRDLVFSYDISALDNQPLTPFLTLKF